MIDLIGAGVCLSHHFDINLSTVLQTTNGIQVDFVRRQI
jgi:hypothetical protein